MKKLYHSETASIKENNSDTHLKKKNDIKISTALFLQNSQKYLDKKSPNYSPKIFPEEENLQNFEKTNFSVKQKNFRICLNSTNLSLNDSLMKNDSILNSPKSELIVSRDYKPSKFSLENKKLNFLLKNEKFQKSNFSLKNEVFPKSNFSTEKKTNNQKQSNFFISNENLKTSKKTTINKEIYPEDELTFFEKKTLSELNDPKNCEKFISKLKVFKKVTLILIEIFRGKNINLKVQSLKLSEFQVIVKTLQKKYDLRIFQLFLEKTNKENLNEAISELEKIIYDKPINVSRKRIEENNKFIYKNSIKIMKKLFYIAKRLPKSKSSEADFYQYYFKEISLRKDISLENFIDPLNCKRNVKTLNNKFLSLIFSSENFKNDFKKVMINELFFNYEKLILRKFVKFFEKFDNQYNSSFDFEVLCGNVIKYLKDNKRIKFPWDKNEIENAIFRFLKKIKTL